jgi:hypothetical protein
MMQGVMKEQDLTVRRGAEGGERGIMVTGDVFGYYGVVEKGWQVTGLGGGVLSKSLELGVLHEGAIITAPSEDGREDHTK